MIDEAIRAIPSDDRDVWVQVGMAVKSELGDGGFDLWDSWSQTSDRYNKLSARAVWRSIRPDGGITARTLFKMARDNGWKGIGSVTPIRAPRASSGPDIELMERRRKAAQKAAQMLSECRVDVHPYIESKGFPDQVVNVLDGAVLIPMLYGGEVVGCQTIEADGTKKFMYGQRSAGAEFVIGRGALHILCEGYATALSAQAVLRNLKVPYSIHVTFSAGNMKRIAQGLPGGVVLADNDASNTGERVAQEIGWPSFMSDTVGEDFNDFQQRVGTFTAAMRLRPLLARRRTA